MEKSIEAFAELNGVDVHAVGIGGGVSENLLQFFDNTGSEIENSWVEVNGGWVNGSTGKVDIVNTAEDLDAVLQGSSEREELDDVGNDILRGGGGDDIIFGDALEHADHPGMGVQGIKDYLQAETGAEPTDEELSDFIRDNHESLVMPAEQGGDDILIGGEGNDLLYGGAGADTFVWELGDQGTEEAPATDTVMDFNLSEGDRLDIGELLSDMDEDTIDQYIQVGTDKEGETVLNISTKGGLGDDGENADQHIVLNGVDMGSQSSSDFLQSLLQDVPKTE